MLPKYQRVTKSLFDKVLKEGKTIHGDLLYLRYIPKGLDKYSHFAFVVPKSVSKTAVDRNKLRRRGNAVLHSIDLGPSIGVFFYKKGSQKVEFSDLSLEIHNLISKAHLIK